jgi:murein DD-endopeptidase MepM/ murein hydrolase activator NlpD
LKKDQNQQNITNDLDNTSTQFPSNIRRVGEPCEACRENARSHHGWDLTGNIGGENPNIVANIEGTVTAVNTGNNPDINGGGYGKWIEIQHTPASLTEKGIPVNWNYSFYAHLDNVLVKEGAPTSPGTILGTQGTTGRSSGDHLHFERRMTPPTGYNAQSWNTNSIPINRVAKGKGGEGWPVKTTVSTLDKYFYFTKS